MSFNQQVGVTNNPLAKARPNDLLNEEVVGKWFKARFGKDPEKDKAYFREWMGRMKRAYNDEGKDGFPFQADNKSIRVWKKITGRRQVRVNTKDEATIKGPSDDREYFEFLDELRESGRTNMMGAGPYLRREFGMDRNEARKVLLRWMRSKRDRRPTYFDRD
tara:strand:+ start:103 stop:588 length:486 start_codon:yes stop_codon:yes gene_type:complete